MLLMQKQNKKNQRTKCRKIFKVGMLQNITEWCSMSKLIKHFMQKIAAATTRQYTRDIQNRQLSLVQSCNFCVCDFLLE